MLFNWKSLAALPAAVVLCGAVAALSCDRAVATEKEGADVRAVPDFSWVDKRMNEIFPTAKETRFDEIGWAKGIREAERLGKENNRPVFLFCNVGQMDLGRC